MLKLYSPEEIDAVSRIFSQIEVLPLDEATSPGSNVASPPAELCLSMGGLEIMNDDPSNTHVVFIDVNRDRARLHLESILFTLQRELGAVGLLDERERQRMFLVDNTFAPKFHATVMNTRLRRSTRGTTHTRQKHDDGHEVKRSPAEMATAGVSLTTQSGKLSHRNQKEASRKAAGLKQSFGEREPLDASAFVIVVVCSANEYITVCVAS